MKKKIFTTLSFSIIFFTAIAQQTTTLYFENSFGVDANGKVSSYTFGTGDIAHFPALTNSGTSNTCYSYSYWTRQSRFTLELKSTSMASFIIYGKSGASTDRTIVKIEVADALDGTYQDVTTGTTITSTIKGSNCGTITVTGLNIANGKFVKITFDTGTLNVLVSAIEITSFVATGNSLIQADKKVVSKKYYSILGEEVSEYAEGLVIKKTIFEDGSATSKRILKHISR